MCKRWLALRSELVGNFVVLIAGVLAVYHMDTMSAAWVGLTVSFAMSITETFHCVLNNGENEHISCLQRSSKHNSYTLGSSVEE